MKLRPRWRCRRAHRRRRTVDALGLIRMTIVDPKRLKNISVSTVRSRYRRPTSSAIDCLCAEQGIIEAVAETLLPTVRLQWPSPVGVGRRLVPVMQVTCCSSMWARNIVAKRHLYRPAKTSWPREKRASVTRHRVKHGGVIVGVSVGTNRTSGQCAKRQA